MTGGFQSFVGNPIKAGTKEPNHRTQLTQSKDLNVTKRTGTWRHIGDQLDNNPHQSTNEIEPHQLSIVELLRPRNRWNEIGPITFRALFHTFTLLLSI
jgi:hypothetical protein